jgi:hypothetical protein
MFKAILFTQWRWGRVLVATCVVAGFAIPVFSVRNAGGGSWNGPMWNALDLLASMQSYGPIYVLLAGFAGIALSTSAWAPDHAGRHVYALSLPLARWHYVLLRYGSGVVLLVPVSLALWIGALVASVSTPLPTGLHAYPGALALRFALASVLSFSVIFAVASGTKRSAGYALAVLLGLVLADLLISLFGGTPVVIESTLGWLFSSSGVFGIFTGRWMLIDV